MDESAKVLLGGILEAVGWRWPRSGASVDALNRFRAGQALYYLVQLDGEEDAKRALDVVRDAGAPAELVAGIVRESDD